jgi:hypothetical protein
MGPGELLALLGAALVIASLFSDWYQSAAGRLSAWDTFGPALALLIAAAAGALALVVATLSQDAPAMPVALGTWSTLLAIGALISAVVRVLERPQHATAVCAGAWLALAGAIAMLVGSWLSLRDERTRLYELPTPTLKPPPPA